MTNRMMAAVPNKAFGFLSLLDACLLLLIVHISNAGTPAPALFYEYQLVDHLLDTHVAPTARATQPHARTQAPIYWTQRYYVWDKHFQGAGSPIFVLLGGEGAIEPSTGLLYPFVTNELAVNFGAYVLQPEHRFYGASQPVSAANIHQAREAGLPDPRIQLLTFEQALLDAMRLIVEIRNELGCSPDRFSVRYCPVITVGGSYPGFLSAMARIMFPHIVDMAYAASAPMRFYAQQVPQTAYYQRITSVADKASPGCPDAVRSTLALVQHEFRSGKRQRIDIGACPGTIPGYCDDDSGGSIDTFLDETFMMAAYTFANDNMAFYPPSKSSRLCRACEIFMDQNQAPIGRLRNFLVESLSVATNSTTTGICFNMSDQLPTGSNATISAGDWSGVGTGQSGESWDFQTCTLCVEAIGFDNSTSMFPDRVWSMDWLTDHCHSRFNVTPEPFHLRERWHIDDVAKTGATHIIFTNGLNDGWSVSGILTNLSDTLLALNFPNGAHHSDLSRSGPSDADTDDIRQGFVRIRTILADWLDEMRVAQVAGGT